MGANRTFFDMQSMSRGLILIAGAFQPNGSSAISLTTVKGHGFVPTRTGVGAYLVTLEDVFVDYVAITCQLAAAALANNKVRIGSVDISAKTIEILAYQEDGDTTVSAVEVANDADTWVHFQAWLKNTSVTR